MCRRWSITTPAEAGSPEQNLLQVLCSGSEPISIPAAFSQFSHEGRKRLQQDLLRGNISQPESESLVSEEDEEEDEEEESEEELLALSREG